MNPQITFKMTIKELEDDLIEIRKKYPQIIIQPEDVIVTPEVLKSVSNIHKPRKMIPDDRKPNQRNQQ